MKKLFWAALVAFILFSQPAHAEGQQENLFDAMQKTYASMTSMTCEFEQTLVHRESGARTIRPGLLKFKKPLLTHWEVRGEEHEFLIVSKDEVWDYLPDEEVAYRYSWKVVDQSNSFLKIITGQANLREDFETASEGLVDDGTVEYHLYPFQPTQQLTEAYVWLERGSGIIKRVRIIDFFGNENDIRFNSVDFKVDLSDSVFEFTPPKGVDVEDNFNNDNMPEHGLFQ